MAHCTPRSITGYCVFLILAGLVLHPGHLRAQSFTLGNLAVLKVGDGVAPLSSAAAPLTIVEFNTVGIPTGVSVNLPSSGTSKITISGSATSEGIITMSAERDRVVVAGYDAAAGTANVAASPSGTTNRELFTVANDGSYFKAMSSATAYNANNIRTGTVSGTSYFSAGSSTTNGILLLNSGITLNATNSRVVQIFNGQTYFSASSGTFVGIYALGTGIPTISGQSVALKTTFNNSPFAFAISPDSNTLYVADENVGIIKYAKNAATQNYDTVYTVTTTHARGLAVDFSGSHPILFATTTGTVSNTVIKVIDLGPGSSANTIATSPTNTLYRSITFSPACYASIAISGPGTICQGANAYFTISGNPSATVTYTINGGALQTATIGVNGTSRISTGPLTADAAISLVSITTPACAAVPVSGSVSITVNPSPASITGIAAICNGNGTTLADVTPDGNWSSSNTAVASVGTSGIVTSNGTGTTTISYILPTTCYITRDVTVNPLPSPVTGAGAICSGTSATLGTLSSGGTWSSSNSAVAAIGVSTGTVTGNATSTTTATITYTLPTGCYTTAAMTVNPAPSPLTGNSALCNGAATTLTETIAGGTWSSSNGNATVSSSGVVTGIAAGSGAISYVLPNSCYTIKDITVNPMPSAISGGPAVCSGSQITLSALPTGGTWTSSDNAVAAIGATGIVTGNATTATTATITYTLSTGCYATTIITVNPAPGSIGGNNSVCTGFTTALSETTTSGTWSSSNGNATVSSTGVVTGSLAGPAAISYTLASGCFASKDITVNPSPGAISGVAAVCAGGNITLGDPVAGGTWSSSNTAVAAVGSGSGAVSALSPGTSVISYAMSTGCFATAVVTSNIVPAAITGTTTVCAGATTALNNITAGGTWSTSNTLITTVNAVSGIVSGVAGGTSSVLYTLGTGCSSAVVVTVNPLPLAITGSGHVCIGSGTTLSTLSTGGTWSLSGVAAAIDAASGVLTGLSAGTVLVAYTFSTGCYTTAPVTVNALPAVIAGPAVTCMGGTTTLSNSSSGGTWTSGLPAVAAIGSTSGIASGLSAGTAVITYTLSSGCQSTMVLTVNALPAPIAGSLSMCTGTSAVFTDINPGGTWMSGAPGIATIGLTTGAADALAPGIAPITYTGVNGCSITANVTVNVTPLPVAGTLGICVGGSATLNDATPGGLWTAGSGTATIGGATGVVTGILSGTVTVSYALSSGCSASAVVTVNPVPAPIGGPGAVCAGLSVNLSNAVFGGTWSSSNASVATIGSGSGMLTGVSAGTVLVSYTLSTGCSIAAVISVNPLPASIAGTTITCVAGTTTLSDASAGGTWISGNSLVATAGTITGIVTGIAPGTARITYTLPTGCKANTIITISATPSAIAGSPIVCNGATGTLVNSAGGGIWTSSNTSVAVTGTSGATSLCIVTGVSAGSATITYAIGGCTAYYAITVSATPSAISGNDIICQESATIFTDSIAGGEWNSSNAGIVTVSSSGLVTGVAQGTAIITYSINAVCIATAMVTVNPSSPFARITTHPAGPLCTNTLYQNFGANIPRGAGVEFKWSVTNGELYATGADGQYCLISFHSGGESVIRLSSGIGGCVRTDSFVATVSEQVVPLTGITYYNSDLVFLDNTSTYYQWGYDDAVTLDSTIAADARSQDYYVPELDLAHKMYWAISEHQGCVQKTYFNTPAAAGAVLQSQVALEVYPNPARSLLNVALQGNNGKERIAIQIVDISGNVLHTALLTGGKGIIDVSGLSAGVYFVTASDGNIVLAVRRFIKE